MAGISATEAVVGSTDGDGAAVSGKGDAQFIAIQKTYSINVSNDVIPIAV